MNGIQSLSPGVLSSTPDLQSMAKRGMTEKLAGEFESLMIGQLLKQMRSTVGESGLFPGDDADVFGGMFDSYFGKFISENGGFGLGELFASTDASATDTIQP